MLGEAEALSSLADALRYPDAASMAAAYDAPASFAGDAPELADALVSLGRFFEEAGPGEPEEVYTRLFDLAPVCALHAGYHLFGDAYQRGTLLAGLGEELRKAGIAPGEELPDHLPLLLTLLPRLSAEDRGALVETLLAPALSRMAAALEGNDHPWALVLCALPSAFPSILAAPSGAAPEAMHA